jgi:ankyrin repeat protein
MVTHYGLPNLIKFFLDDGTDINAPSVYYGTALHAAVNDGYEDVVRLLVE